MVLISGSLPKIKFTFFSLLVGPRTARIPFDLTLNSSTESSNRENACKNDVHLRFLAETAQRVVFVMFLEGIREFFFKKP